MLLSRSYDSAKKNERIMPNKFQQQKILLQKQGSFYKVNAKDITYIKVEGRYTSVSCSKGNFLIQMPLKKWCEILSELDFVQISRSTLLNIESIKQINMKDNLLILENGSQHNIGRQYKSSLQSRFIMFE